VLGFGNLLVADSEPMDMIVGRHSGEAADLECHRQDFENLLSYVFDRNIRESIPQNSGAPTMIAGLEKLKTAILKSTVLKFPNYLFYCAILSDVRIEFPPSAFLSR
jgi:hypothetical protein